MMIPLRDESELTWFFCHGEAEFQRSVHGAMVAQLERDSMGANRCCCCGGAGIIETAKAVAMHNARRLGNVTTHRERAVRDPDDHMWRTEEYTEVRGIAIGDECRICGGTGWVAAKRLKPRCDCWGEPREVRRACPRCLGTGTPAITARPTHLAHESGGVEVDGDTLKRYAAVSRRLARMRRRDRETLRTHYGPEGRSWADQPMGRLLGLMAVTYSGLALLARTRVTGDEGLEVSAAERIAAQDALESAKPKRWRRGLIDEARTEAEALLRYAHINWVNSGRRPWREELEELEDAIDASGQRWERWLDEHWTAGVDVEEEARCG